MSHRQENKHLCKMTRSELKAEVAALEAALAVLESKPGRSLRDANQQIEVYAIWANQAYEKNVIIRKLRGRKKSA